MAVTVDALADALGVSRGAVTTIKVTAGGSGYTSPPAVAIGAPPSRGTQATATATIDDDGAVTITVTSGGSGYTSPPDVAVGAPPSRGTQATATATIEGNNEAARLLSIAGALVDAYLRDPDDTLECPEGIRDEAVIRTAGHVQGRAGYGKGDGRMKIGTSIQIDIRTARSAVRQSGAAALLSPWTLRTA